MQHVPIVLVHSGARRVAAGSAGAAAARRARHNNVDDTNECAAAPQSLRLCRAARCATATLSPVLARFGGLGQGEVHTTRKVLATARHLAGTAEHRSNRSSLIDSAQTSQRPHQIWSITH